jgi:hypothetical protein
MRRKKGYGSISILLVLAVALYPFASSGTAIAAPAGKDVLVMKAGLLKGAITDMAGLAVSELPIELFDGNGATVSKAVTNKSGKFVMDDLQAGGYTLAVGEHYILKLALKKDAEASEMKVVVPEEGSVDPAKGFTTTHLLVGGTIIVVIVAVAVAVSDGGSHHSRVSP